MTTTPLTPHGLHHVTAVTADARANLRYYTQTLGLRLVKKTVNQDDVTAYHLFYADRDGTPAATSPSSSGTSPRTTRQPQRQPHQPACPHRHPRLVAGPPDRQRHPVTSVTRHGRPHLDFSDPEGQRLSLVEGGPDGTPGTPAPSPQTNRSSAWAPAN